MGNIERLDLEKITSQDHNSLEIISKLGENNLCPVETSILDRSKDCGFNCKDAEDIKWAAIEFVTNAIKHGNEMDSSKKVRLHTTKYQNVFYVAVEDEGKGFDLEYYRISAGRPGLNVSWATTDDFYNFGDNVVYLAKTLKE